MVVAPVSAVAFEERATFGWSPIAGLAAPLFDGPASAALAFASAWRRPWMLLAAPSTGGRPGAAQRRHRPIRSRRRHFAFEEYGSPGTDQASLPVDDLQSSTCRPTNG